MKEQMKEAFQAWWGQAPIELEPLKPRSIDENVSVWAWQAWQAALSAVPANHIGDSHEMVEPTDISKQLREYAADSGYSHNDYADTMLAAASEIERCAARLESYLRESKSQPAQEPVNKYVNGWKHSCAALLTDGVELWVDRCPHCGKPAPQEPAKQESNVFIDVNFMLPEMNTPVLGLVGKNLYALARVDYDDDAGWLWAVGSGDLSDIRNYEADDDYQPSCWIPLPLPSIKEVTE